DLNAKDGIAAYRGSIIGIVAVVSKSFMGWIKTVDATAPGAYPDDTGRIDKKCSHLVITQRIRVFRIVKIGLRFCSVKFVQPTYCCSAAHPNISLFILGNAAYHSRTETYFSVKYFLLCKCR